MSYRPRSRLESEFKRREGGRIPRKTILIICEGESTEPHYFEELKKRIRLTTAEVEVVGQGAEIKGLIKAALRLKKDREQQSRQSPSLASYDEVWCVVDTELEKDNVQWESGVQLAQVNEIKLAWSNPCFEYWLLLHLEKVGSSFNGKQALVHRIRTHFDFRPNKPYFENLAHLIPNAMAHSIEIHKAQWQTMTKIMECNPATTVHELVERLLGIASITVDDYRSKFTVGEVVPAPSQARGKSSSR